MWLFLMLVFCTGYMSEASDVNCTAAGGTCMIWPTNTCLARWEMGLCKGGKSRRCCIRCESQCLSNIETFQNDDRRCNNVRGKCQDSSNYCNGRYVASLCGGAPTRQCCDPKSSFPEDCPLITYSPTTTIRGFDNTTIRIHPEFLPAMELISGAAETCNATVFILHSFRKKQHQGRLGTRSKSIPHKRNNHLVGHAVDIAGLQSSTGWCNGKCLLIQSSLVARCFIDEIKKSGLKWGGDFVPPDPVHVDDGFGDNGQAWRSLMHYLQNNC